MLMKIWNFLWNWILSMRNSSATFQDTPSLIVSAEEAKQEWLYAQRLYETFTEPELIEYAAYLIKANEAKYMYFLRLTKQQGIRSSPLGLEFFQSGNLQVAKSS